MNQEMPDPGGAADAPAGAGLPQAQPPEQQRYAGWLRAGSVAGLVMMLLGFVAYAFALGPATVPPSMLPRLWTLSAAELVRAGGSPTLSNWAAIVGSGETAALAGIAVLAGSAVPGLLSLVPLYLRRGDLAFVALCLAEAVVIVLAASGWLGGGH